MNPNTQQASTNQTSASQAGTRQTNTFLYSQYLVAISMLLFSINCVATDFSTNFESTNFNTVQDFTVTNNGLSATFSGGTSFRIGNGDLYHSGIKSWMLDPAGTTSRGTSTGEGTITFSTSANALDFYIRTSNSGSTGQVQIIDDSGAVIEDITSTIVNGSWLRIEKTLNDGDSLMASVTVRAFGSNMLAIDDLSFSTVNDSQVNDDTMGDEPANDDNEETESSDDMADETTEDAGGIYSDDTQSSSSSGGGAAYLVLFLLSLFLRRKLIDGYNTQH
jgi:hypothetical protein